MSHVDFVQQKEAGECFAEEAAVVIDVASGALAPLGIIVRVVRPRGSKCPRCWNFRAVSAGHVCTRCQEATGNTY